MNTPDKLYPTDHAINRATERFPQTNIHNEINGPLTPLSGQKGNTKAYLTQNNLVLITKNQNIITIMTQPMYNNNINTQPPPPKHPKKHQKQPPPDQDDHHHPPKPKYQRKKKTQASKKLTPHQPQHD